MRVTVIVGIDGENVFQKQPGKVAALLLGPPGSIARIEVERPPQNERIVDNIARRFA